MMAVALRSALAKMVKIACGREASSITTVARVSGGTCVYLALVDYHNRQALCDHLAQQLQVRAEITGARQLVFSRSDAVKIIDRTAGRGSSKEL
jgi:hypothetical protein